jgi:hypothetical protein
MLTINQVRLLLKYALLPQVHSHIESPTQACIAEWRNKLELAEQIWETVSAAPGGDLTSHNLPLALERLYFELLSIDGGFASPRPLLEIVYEADRRQDFQSQILARLSILSYCSSDIPDWRDLYSIFELCEVDCGNMLECHRIWDMFARWTLNWHIPDFGFPYEHCTLSIIRGPRQPPRHPFLREWAKLLHGRASSPLEPPGLTKEALDPWRPAPDSLYLPERWYSLTSLQRELESILEIRNKSSKDMPEQFADLHISSQRTREPGKSKEGPASPRWSIKGTGWRMRDVSRWSLSSLFSSSGGKGSAKGIESSALGSTIPTIPSASSISSPSPVRVLNCRKCQFPLTLANVKSTEDPAKVNRPYYRCDRCGEFCAWADDQGVAKGNPSCQCGELARLSKSASGTFFYSCAKAQCEFYMERYWRDP